VDPRDQATTTEVRDLASEIASGMGLEVVDLVFQRSAARWLLRVEIDRAGARGVGIDDCRQLSLALGAALDREDCIEHIYVIEVSSPGIDRPIRSVDDIRRNTGRRIVVDTAVPLNGRRSFRGILAGLDGEDCRVIEDQGSEVRIPLKEIARAKQDPAL
jgi:ribosome maturation factor RimP